MKALHLLSLALVSTSLTAGPRQFSTPLNRSTVAPTSLNRCTAAPTSLNRGPAALTAASAASLSPSSTLTGRWGAITAVDGTNWYYTQDIDADYTQSTITFYDELCQEQCQFGVQPQLPEGYTLNVIQPFGTITTRFFDTQSATWEVMVYVHGYDAEYHQYAEIRAYNNLGELVYTTPASNALFFDSSSGFTTYQRVILITSELDALTGQSYDCFTVMRPAQGDAGPTAEHTFRIASELFYYGEGPTFSTFSIDGEPYYVIPHFGKLYATLPEADEEGEMADEDITVTPDNTFEVEVYDRNYQEAAHLSLPIEVPEGVLYRFPAFGMFSYSDLSRGYYTGDSQFNFVITQYDYYTEVDDEFASIEVYDQSGQQLKTLAQNCVSWSQLADVPGQADQYKFVRQYLDGTQDMVTVDLPSGEEVTHFGDTAGGMQASSYLDRYAVGDTYQYAMGMNEGTYDRLGRVVGYIGWFDQQGQLDHFDSFPMAAGVSTFTPWISGRTLNPYLINTDAQHEYIVLVKQQNDEGGYDDVLYIVGADGSTIATFGKDDEMGAVNQVGLAEGEHPALLIGYWGWDAEARQSTYVLARYDLPFESFVDPSGEEGEHEEGVYYIQSAGDLALMGQHPAATYRLAADIDMRQYYGRWEPIAGFTGTLDGCGHSIDYLTVNATENGQYFAGLFGRMGDMLASTTTTIRNLTLRHARITVGTSSCVSAGIVAGQAMGVTMDSVMVYDAQIVVPEAYDVRCGGLTGEASNQGSFGRCLVDDLTIDAPHSTEVGGIVGSLKTATHVTACAAHGSFTARGDAGGIVGLVGNQAGINVTDCHTDVSISATGSHGGIVGTNMNALVERCVADQGTLCGYVDEYAGGMIRHCLTQDQPAYSYSVWESDPDSESNPGVSDNYRLSDFSEPLSAEWLTAQLGLQFGQAVDAPWYLDGSRPLPQLWLEHDAELGIDVLPAEEQPTQHRTSAGALYNLLGQRVSEPRRGGIYIRK